MKNMNDEWFKLKKKLSQVMENPWKEFERLSVSNISPYHIFVDDTCKNISQKSDLLGLCVKYRGDKRRAKPSLSFIGNRVWHKNKVVFDTYDSNSGISCKGMKVLMRHIRRENKKIKSVIFDWDKTLTQHSNFKATSITKYVCECYFGGYHRMNQLKRMFAICRKHKINIYVLTFNRKAKQRTGRRDFYKALSYMKCVPKRIIYSDGSKMAVIPSFD